MSKARWIAAIALAILPSGVPAQKREKTPPPIYIPTPRPTSEQYGSWIVESLGKGLYSASVTNENNRIFGVLCAQGNCQPFIDTGVTCDEKGKYPLLVNSPASAYTDTGECHHIGKLTMLLMGEMDGVADSMSIGGLIGFATPMQSGDFKVSRFTLTGSMRAYARAKQLAAGTQTQTESKTVPSEQRL